jgi:hypothetical protein
VHEQLRDVNLGEGRFGSPHSKSVQSLRVVTIRVPLSVSLPNWTSDRYDIVEQTAKDDLTLRPLGYELTGDCLAPTLGSQTDFSIVASPTRPLAHASNIVLVMIAPPSDHYFSPRG